MIDDQGELVYAVMPDGFEPVCVPREPFDTLSMRLNTKVIEEMIKRYGEIEDGEG